MSEVNLFSPFFLALNQEAVWEPSQFPSLALISGFHPPSVPGATPTLLVCPKSQTLSWTGALGSALAVLSSPPPPCVTPLAGSFPASALDSHDFQFLLSHTGLHTLPRVPPPPSTGHPCTHQTPPHPCACAHGVPLLARPAVTVAPLPSVRRARASAFFSVFVWC